MYSILVVEDEFNIRENLQELLEAEGFEVHTAPDGEEGFKTAKIKMPDIILSDVRMPKMDGIQFLTMLQNDPETAAIPLIFLSAKVEIDDIRKGMVSGADDYIPKPFKAEDVLQAINARLKKKRNYQNIIEELRNSFIKNVPHELRTPLISILGFSELVENDIESLTQEEIKDMARTINKSGKRLHRWIEKLIEYGFLLSLNENITDMKKLTSVDSEYYPALFSQKAKEFDREKDVKISFEKAILKIEDNLFQPIITELLENALKFSNPGSSIKITGKLNSQGYSIEIEDNGIGLDIKRIEEADIFNKLDRNFENREGLGLGLAIVKRIAEIRKINIGIDSKPEKFTKIMLSIPIV